MSKDSPDQMTYCMPCLESCVHIPGTLSNAALSGEVMTVKNGIKKNLQNCHRRDDCRMIECENDYKEVLDEMQGGIGELPQKPCHATKISKVELLEESSFRQLRKMFGAPARLDSQQRRQTNQEYKFSCVKVSLNQFCRAPGKALNIEDALFNMNKATCEAYLLANLHVMRVCKERQPVCELNQSFFYKCLKAVTLGNRQKIDIREKDLRESARLYRELRPLTCALARSDNLSAGLHNNASQQMAINTKNYIAMTFHKRLSRYVKHRFKLDSPQAHACLTDIYALDYTGDNAIVKEMRGKIPKRAAVGNLERAPHEYMPLLYEMLQYCERQTPSEKGVERYNKRRKQVRLFSLLPSKSGFECSNIKICGTGLSSLLKRQGMLKGWTEAEFEESKDRWWRCLFQIDKFETLERTFAGEVLTDGLSVSILMRRRKGEEQLLKQENVTNERRASRANPVKKKPGPKAGKPLKKELIQPDIDLCSYDNVIGLDPGRKSLFVTCDTAGHHQECSTKEFYHDAKYKESNRKSKRWIEKDDFIREAIRGMPTKKTCDLQVFYRYVTFLLPRLDKLLGFFQQKKFRNQKFKRYVFCKKKLRSLSLRLVDGKRTVIGFGDWSNTDTAGVIKRCPAGPVKRLEEELKKHCTVVVIDEYCTSKKCNRCKSDLYNEKKITTGKDGNKYHVKVHSVLHCHNSVCKSMTLNRDMNASKNIRDLLVIAARKDPRPLCFCRSARSKIPIIRVPNCAAV